MSDEQVGAACCKVGRTAARYGLVGLDEELTTRWTGGEASLRELSTMVNRRVLGAAMRRAGREPLDGETTNRLRLLRGDAPEIRRLEARRRLEREGVDVDDVLGACVSHQTVHTHLRTCLGVSKGNAGDRLERRTRTLFALRGRTGRVTIDALETLRDAGVLSLEGFDVLVDIRVVCERCGRSLTLASLLETEGCGCLVGERDDHTP